MLSQSGDSNLDITMPDAPLGKSSSVLHLKLKEDTPLVLQDLLDQFDFQVPSPNEWLRVETALNSDEQYPTPSPEKSNAPVLDTNLGDRPQGFIYTPNRTGSLPSNSVPSDVPYTEDIQRLEELSPNNEHLGLIKTEQRNDENSQHSISDLMEQFDLSSPMPVEMIQPGNFETFELEDEHQQDVLQHSSAERTQNLSRHNLEQLLHHIQLSFQ